MALEEIGVRTKSFIRPPKHVADCVSTPANISLVYDTGK